MINYSPVIKRINKLMTNKNYQLTSVSDGEDLLKADQATISKLYDHVLSCDFGSMHYKDNAGNKVSFYLVFGNLLHETIADMGYNTEKAEQDSDEVLKNIADFYQ